MNLPCGRHRCILPCHKGPCLKEGQACTQPCTTPRSLCGHICASPCHDGPCPDTPCKEMVCVMLNHRNSRCQESYQMKTFSSSTHSDKELFIATEFNMNE
jgi:transcriptional repressor NF-X1